MNNYERMETLKNNGVDTSKYFTLMVNKDISAGTKINISIDRNEEFAKQIVEDGYVKNTRLHRRFVAAQYFRMLNSPEGWHGYLNKNYGYMYQFDMMFEEVRVLSKLQTKDRETFSERNAFFSLDVVIEIIADYVKDVRNYVNSLPAKNCKGRKYVTVKGYGNVFCDEVDKKIMAPIEGLVEVCKRSYNYKTMYENLMALKKVMIKLPYETKKSASWVDAFQLEGAFYTLKNLIMFHDVKLYYNGEFCSEHDSMVMIKRLVYKGYEGYEMNGLLKATIAANNFNFGRSCAEHR